MSDEIIQGVEEPDEVEPGDSAPHLERILGFRGVVLFGLAYMAPLIVLGTFGVLAQVTHGATAGAYLLALVAVLFTAISYGRMVKNFPVAGSAYTYVRHAIDSRLGFMVGWATLLDYFFLPMVVWLIGAAFLQQAMPGVPVQIWILGFIIISTVINLFGLKLAGVANILLMLFQLIVLVAFVGLSLGYVSSHEGGPSAWFSLQPFVGENAGIAAIAAGAAVAAYSFLGFDAVTTLTEETKHPHKTLPRAILTIALLGGGIFIVVSYATQLVHPGDVFNDVDAAAFEIAGEIGGHLFESVFLAGLVITQLAAGIAAQASASRLLYVMGRDGALPKKFFGYVHPKLRTPLLSVIATGVVGLIALFLTVSTSTSFIDFGAFTAFTFVNLSVIVLWFRRRREGLHPGPWIFIVIAALGAVIDVWLLFSLSVDAHIIGGVWLVFGLIYLTFLTRGFRRPPPEMGMVSH